MCLGVDMGNGMDSTAARSTCSRAQPSDPPRGKLRLLDQLIRFPVDLDQVIGGLGGGVNPTRVGPWCAGVTT